MSSGNTSNSTAPVSSPLVSSQQHRPATPSPRDPTIRHAGRAHIRGKIRRVWRPRYLELCDSGLVRYYELPPTADVTLPEDSDWDHVNMIPKDTLVIFYARIIDVTTLRDLHVGLPKGSYGFLFRGQRQLHLELAQTNEPNPPREYFCAVGTLEEAQTWVIVLQWAASVGKYQRQFLRNSSLSSSPSSSVVDGSTSINFLGDSCQIPVGARIPSVTDPFGRHPPEARNMAVATDPEGDHDIPPAPSPMPRKSVGRIVVTKVHGYRLVKANNGGGVLELSWQIAFEIAVLLIQGSKIDERRVLRTSREFIQVLQQLQQELDSKISLTLVDEWKSKLERTKLPGSLREDLPAEELASQIVTSFTLVDQLLRALAMDANIVNSNAMKECFLLDQEDPKEIGHDWWKAPPSTPWVTFRRVLTVSEDETDTFVKDWLSKQQLSMAKAAAETSNNRTLMWMWVLQRPWMILGGAGVGLAVSVPLAKVYQQVMVSVSLRLDVLVGSWCLAAYFGNNYLPTIPGRELPRSSRRSRDLRSSRRLADQNQKRKTTPLVVVKVPSDENEDIDASSVDSREELVYLDQEEDAASITASKLSSPLPQYPQNNGESCWSIPPDNRIFRVRGHNYLEDRIKIPSGPSPFVCRGVDVWLTPNPERHIARHPSVLNGKLGDEDTFLVNFLLPFGNFVSYFTVPPISEFPERLAKVWTKFVQGDQQYRDKRLKLLPVVIDGPWIVKAAVGNGTAPALLGKVIPLQYFFQAPTQEKKGVYEVDVIITASSIAKGILSVVKGHTKSLTIAFAFIIEAAEQEELPETVLCAFQVHALHLEDCPHLPECNLDEI